MLSLMQYLFIILPKADDAAVWMIPFPFAPFFSHLLKVSTRPITVTGFTTPDAAELSGTVSSITHILLTSTATY
jgi:hypothetical protein